MNKDDKVHVSETSFAVRSASGFRKFSDRLDSLGVEMQGIQRIPPNERGTSRQLMHVVGLWLSAAGGLSSMSSYFLGPMVFDLEFKQTIVSGLIPMWIGCAIAGYCSTMGPQSGCRQMVTARYLFGWWFVRIVALAGIVGVMGWSVVNCVVGGQMLASISDGKVPIWVGVVIVTAVSFLVATFGIRQVLRMETLFAFPVLTCFGLLYISASNKFHYAYDFHNDFLDSETLKGNWLSFFSVCYSITSTWGSITADYYILFPENTPKRRVFLLTFLGIMLPTTFVGMLAILLASAAKSYLPWSEAYAEYGMGGLLNAGFSRWGGFGKFCVVVLLLSLISNNIINTYSAALSIQLISPSLLKVPRWAWSVVCTAVYFVCALVGRNHFADILGNFLPMIGYWVSIYFIILLEENVIFRTFFLRWYTMEFPADPMPHKIATRHAYNWDEWNNPSVLTRGIAAIVAFCVGIAGAVLGMSQTYYVGVLAAKIGQNGGDLGSWLAMSFAGIVYPLLRFWELKKFGR